MRTLKLLAAAASVLFVAGTANAAILLELELFGSPGVTTASPGSNVTLAVFVSPGTEGVSEVNYNVLTSSGVAVLGVNQSITLPGTDPNCPATSFSNCNMSQLAAPILAGNNITNYNIATGGLGPNGGRYQIGIARFNFAGGDTVSITYNIANDNTLPLAQPIAVRNSTTFSIVPEPAVASMLLLGLGGLALAGRRRS